ncbi:MAG: hypothetical protein JXA87_07150 [Thermoleophilia bacterium]|nr:hypothetical protein [Thermoleophilia bacterium]
MKRSIFGIHISQRAESVPDVQAVLSKYGCNIRTRLGIHDAGPSSCSPAGLVLIDAFGAETEDFFKELQGIEGVEVQRMDFKE